ncbi:MAG: four helix bundle protein [Candidatus Marinimicrobia bacterium]|nr:four helix bundle protein [Candidatus Neomarinimicrobiota bacterium]
MATIHRFEEIESWQKARELVKAIYTVTRRGDFTKDYGLKDQIQRAAVSIMSNIAEGYERDGKGEFIQFLSIAKASAGEVKSQLYVALDTGYLSEAEFSELSEQADGIARLIGGLIKYLKSSKIKGNKYR